MAIDNLQRTKFFLAIIMLTTIILSILGLITVFTYFIVSNVINKPPEKLYSVSRIVGEKFGWYKSFRVSWNSTLRAPNYIISLNGATTPCANPILQKDALLPSRNASAFNNISPYVMARLASTPDDCESFITSNAVPQLGTFAIWRNVEKHVRDNYRNDSIVITAPRYDYAQYIFDNQSRALHIPVGFYKIVLDKAGRKLFSVYIQHNEDMCWKDFMRVGDFNALPWFVV